MRSALPGKVVISEENPTMGKWVGVYNGEHNLLVTYWHLQGRMVREGEWVQVYAPLGKVGSTGNSTAPHLHVQVNRGSSFDYSGHINPHVALSIYSRRKAKEIHDRHPEHPMARA